jgi:hypothetical protein
MCITALPRLARQATRAEATVLYLVHGGTRSAAGGPSAGLLLTEPLRGLADLAALLVAAPGCWRPRAAAVTAC